MSEECGQSRVFPAAGVGRRKKFDVLTPSGACAEPQKIAYMKGGGRVVDSDPSIPYYFDTIVTDSHQNGIAFYVPSCYDKKEVRKMFLIKLDVKS